MQRHEIAAESVRVRLVGALRPQVHPLRFAEGRTEFEPVMPPQSVAALKIELAR